MPKLSARERILVGVLAVGSIALWLGLPGDRESFEGSDGKRDAEARQLGEPPPPVRVDLLALKTPDVDPHGRDLFKYSEPPKPLPPPQPTETPPAPTIDRPPASPPPPLSAEPTPPEPAFTYLGYLGPKDDMIAVFDRGAEVFVAQIGDTVGDGFELLEFRYEAVVLGHIGEEYKGETATLKKRSS